ncbi:MAG: phosphonate C-P lyase system protein PhnH [Deinococcota bacterium]
MTVPARSDHEAVTHSMFNALMWALSYPGEAQALADASLEHTTLEYIGLTLLDLETSFYTPDNALEERLKVTGARAKHLQDADYLFYSHLTEDDLEGLEHAKRGDMLYPDRAATIILQASFGSGTTLQLTGPGIETSTALKVDGIPAAFWQLRNKTRHYPLGWDVVLVDGVQVVGIPRSTAVTIIGEAS